MNLALDATVRLGDILTFLGIIGGGFTFLLAMKGELKLLTREMALQNETLKTHSTRIAKVEDVLVIQGRHTERLDMMDKRIDELRHGEGFVRNRRHAIDGEYP